MVLNAIGNSPSARKPLIHKYFFSSNSGSSILVGQNITLTCNVTGRPFTEVRLQKERRNIFRKRFRRRVSSWHLNYNITNITNTDEGCYSCVAYVFTYEGNGVRIFFHVKDPKSPSYSVHPKKSEDEPTYITLNCTANGAPLPEINWEMWNISSGEKMIIDNHSKAYHNDVYSSFNITSFLNFPNPWQPVAFRCIASSPYGTALSNYTAGYFPPSGCTEKAINRTSLLLEVNNITSRSVHLKWNMSRNEILPCDSFYIIKWVQVENEIARSQTSNKELFSEKLNLTTLDFTIRSLVPFTTYLISIAVKTARGENLPRVIRVKTAEDVPTSPTEFKLLGVTSTSCELRWSEPSQPNGLITSYVLHWKRGCNVGKCLPSNQGKILINATGKEMKLNVTDLEPNTAYSMKVAAETSLGEGNYSQSLKVHTKENKMRPSPSPSPAQSPAPSSTKETVHYIIIGIGVLAAALIFAFVISYYRRRRKGRTFLTTTTNLHGSWSHNLEILFPTDPTEVDEWEYPREKLELENGIDHGEFGIVIKGRCTFEKDGQDVHIVVAIKTLRDNRSEQAVRDFKTELKILKEVNVESHKNIVRLIGACTLEEPTLIITEYCSGGNLKILLENSRLNTQSKYENLVSTLTEHDLICFAKDITNGMRFIEEKKFVHRDLAAINVLVDEHNVCKLADFGLARNMHDNGQYIRKNANMRPVKWMAIESLEKGIFTSLSDVWSFGVVLYEIVTLGEEPYPDIPGLDVYRHISCGSRMERPKHCSFEVFSLMARCWETVPEKRPTFCEISEILMDMLYHNTNVYINVTLPES